MAAPEPDASPETTVRILTIPGAPVSVVDGETIARGGEAQVCQTVVDEQWFVLDRHNVSNVEAVNTQDEAVVARPDEVSTRTVADGCSLTSESLVANQVKQICCRVLCEAEQIIDAKKVPPFPDAEVHVGMYWSTFDLPRSGPMHACHK